MHGLGAWIGCWLLSAAPPGPAGGLTLLEAVRTALTKSPTLEAARQDVRASLGAREQAAGQFDWNVTDASQAHLTESPAVGFPPYTADTTSVRFGVSKQLRFGTTISPGVSLSRIEIQEPPGEAPVPTRNTTRVNFQIVQPLLRGVGDANTANEDAAGLEYQATVLDFEHAVSERVLEVVQAYWDYLAAQRKVAAREAAEAAANKLLADMKALVAADQRPASDLEQVEANVADRSLLSIEAKQGMDEARIALGLAIGLDSGEIQALGNGATEFPVVKPPALVPEKLIASGHAQRRDLRAAAARVTEATHQVVAADDTTDPALDLVGDIGYSGIKEGTDLGQLFASIGDIPGANASLSMRLRWPVGNDGPRGALAAAIAQARKAAIRRDDLKRRIGAEIVLAAKSLENAAAALDRSQKAEAHHKKSVENEREKLKVGLSTLIDVILTQDRLTEAAIAKISGEARYARALAALRHETGTLAKIQGEQGEVDETSLVTIPGDSDAGR